MKKKIATLLATVVMVSALFAGPALARDRNDSNQGRWRGGDEWREHHPYPAYPVYPVYQRPWSENMYAPAWEAREWRHRDADDFGRWRRADRDGWRGSYGHDRD
jgi:hypothetical protein